MKRILALVYGILFICIPSAFSQVVRGTIAVIYFGGDKIIVAADSRGSHSIKVGVPPDDSVCKIVVLDQKTIFVFSHFVEYRPASDHDPIEHWNTGEQAHLALKDIRRAYPGTKGHIKQLAERWGDRMQSKFESMYGLYPEGVTKLAQEGEGVLSVGACL